MLRNTKLLGVGVGLLLAASPFADANAQDAKVYYDKGTKIELDGADIKLNVQLQPRYEYTDIDIGARRDQGMDVSGLSDSSSFDMRRGRLVLSGNVLDKQFSYKLQNDFASSDGGSRLQDAWVQWNGEVAKVKFGQYKQPFGREIRISSTKQYFVDYSVLSESFTPNRRQGAQLQVPFGTGNFYASIHNGDSTGEGQNQEGVDPRVGGYVALDWSTESFGSRGVEGDFREDNSDFGMTIGGAYGYGQATDAVAGDFDKNELNADLGFRICGFELYGEYIWSQVKPDLAALPKVENNGFFVSAMMNMLDDKLGLGGRYSWIETDDAYEDITNIDDVQEFRFVVNYFMMGHYLKLQNDFAFNRISPKAGSGANDFRYTLQLAGYF